MERLFKVIEYHKNTRGKYEKTDEKSVKGINVLIDFCNYYERKLDGEKMRIVKHYHFGNTMDVDVYFNNGTKLEYYNIPCNDGEHIQGHKLFEEEKKGGDNNGI